MAVVDIKELPSGRCEVTVNGNLLMALCSDRADAERVCESIYEAFHAEAARLATVLPGTGKLQAELNKWVAVAQRCVPDSGFIAPELLSWRLELLVHDLRGEIEPARAAQAIWRDWAVAKTGSHECDSDFDLRENFDDQISKLERDNCDLRHELAALSCLPYQIRLTGFDVPQHVTGETDFQVIYRAMDEAARLMTRCEELESRLECMTAIANKVFDVPDVEKLQEERERLQAIVDADTERLAEAAEECDVLRKRCEELEEALVSSNKRLGMWSEGLDGMTQCAGKLLKRAEAAESNVRDLASELAQWREWASDYCCGGISAEELRQGIDAGWDALRGRADDAESKVQELERKLDGRTVERNVHYEISKSWQEDCEAWEDWAREQTGLGPDTTDEELRAAMDDSWDKVLRGREDSKREYQRLIEKFKRSRDGIRKERDDAWRKLAVLEPMYQSGRDSNKELGEKLQAMHRRAQQAEGKLEKAERKLASMERGVALTPDGETVKTVVTMRRYWRAQFCAMRKERDLAQRYSATWKELARKLMRERDEACSERDAVAKQLTGWRTTLHAHRKAYRALKSLARKWMENRWVDEYRRRYASLERKYADERDAWQCKRDELGSKLNRALLLKSQAETKCEQVRGWWLEAERHVEYLEQNCADYCEAWTKAWDELRVLKGEEPFMSILKRLADANPENAVQPAPFLESFEPEPIGPRACSYHEQFGGAFEDCGWCSFVEPEGDE